MNIVERHKINLKEIDIMRTLKGRIEDVVNTGKANMDGFTPEEAIYLVKELATMGINCKYSGMENEIKIINDALAQE